MYQIPLSYHYAVAIAGLWLAAGGKKEIELGALEPTLWRDGNKRIDSLVSAFSDMGCIVNMTTNGSTLQSFAKPLKQAGLDMLRISWHSTNPVIFKEISGGHGDYNKFYDGITAAAEEGIFLTFNKVLLKSTTVDFKDQLDFVEKHNCKIKLYDLMWTKEIADIYQSNYIDWRKPVREHILPRTATISRKRDNLGRTRLSFSFKSGGVAQVKMGDLINRNNDPCNSCNYKDVCLEDFADYARVDSALNFYSCYMRRDLGFSMKPYLERNDAPGFKASIQNMMGENVDDYMAKTPLRFTIMPACNFNCRMPGTSQSWCMEMTDEYRFPKIKPTTFKP